MSNSILILGQSGTGKSTAIESLDPDTTFVINVLDKPLPFRGYRKNYVPIHSWDDVSGNYYATDDWSRIIKCIGMINSRRPEITSLVLDDAQYIMGHEFMRRAMEKGFDRFSEIAQHMWLVLRAMIDTRSDLTCFALLHSELDASGSSKAKTIGKMLDDKITLEGMFTVVLHAMASDGQYQFLTQNDGSHICKSPRGMFSELYIPNDLQLVKDAVEGYFQ